MAKKEAIARIKINKPLAEAGWYISKFSHRPFLSCLRSLRLPVWPGYYWWLAGYLLLASWHPVAAQAPPPTTEQLPASFLPKSPTAAALQRFDQQSNVNLMTGAAQAAVPLAELHSGPLQTSVGLNYSFDGLRVVHTPDLVGLGWGLQAGGTITRRVVGLLDTDPSTVNKKYNSDTVKANANKRKFFQKVVLNQADATPDVYDFTVAGYQGRFMVRDTNVVLLPQQTLQIRLLHLQANSDIGFQVTTETGVRYLFITPERTKPNPNNFGHIPEHTSAWQLTQIISAGATDTITFHYSPWDYRETTRLAQTTYRALRGINGVAVGYGDQAPRNSQLYGSTMLARVLDSITTRTSRILIRRRWEDNMPVVKQVDLLSVVASRRRLVRSMSLGQSYFPSLSTVAAMKRRRLDWVQEGNGPLRLPAYQFAYDTSAALPAGNSTGQDHWGYYNGQENNGNNNTTSAFLPHPQLGTLSPERGPNFGFAALGALRRITYPAGGTTTLTYESNRYQIDDNLRWRYDSLSKSTSYTSPYHPERSRLPSQPGTVPGLYEIHGDSIQFTLTEQKRVKIDVAVTPTPPDTNYVDKRVDFLLLKLRPNASTDSAVVAVKAVGAYPSLYVQLEPGRYVAWGLCDHGGRGGSADEDEVAFSVGIPKQIYTPDVAGNGIRVRQTETAAPNAPPLVRTYGYDVETPLGPCSTGLLRLPATPQGQPIYRATPLAVFVQSNELRDYWNTTSDITSPWLGDEYKKQTFYYTRVTEQLGSAGLPAGKTMHYFTDIPEKFNEVVPAQVETYRQDPAAPGQLQLVTKERYGYKQDTATVVLNALLAYQAAELSPQAGTIVIPQEDLYKAVSYRISAAFVAPLVTITDKYSGVNDSTVTMTLNTYHQYRVVRETTYDSQGNEHFSLFHRLRDYTPALPGMAQLQAHNFNPVIEAQQWLKSAGQADSLLVGGTITLYDAKWQQPASVWQLEAARPVGGLNAQQTGSGGLYQSFISDTRYRRKATAQYDRRLGLSVGQQVSAGAATANVWGYQSSALIAQVQNATYSQVAYTSFEPASSGRWRYDSTGTHRVTGGRTGEWAYQLTGTAPVQRGQLPAGEYELTGWVQGSALPALTLSGGSQLGPMQVMSTATGGWQHFRVRLRFLSLGEISLDATSSPILLDEVRLYPVGARMTSYTHEPLVGETSQTGPDGRTIFYEYDGLGRLVRTRDEQGRILGQQQYHYAGQP